MSDIITQPIKFLGATVLSFNTTLGLGASSESTLNVDLIEDCDEGDVFQPFNGSVKVGDPVYFSVGDNGFTFGGVLTTWTINQGGSGKTFNAKVSDPRQLLENTIVVVDSYVGPPSRSNNYFNVYSYVEGSILNGNCGVFGDSQSSDRGMPYTNIVSVLQDMDPTIYSPTGAAYTIDFNSFPQNLPNYYKVPGPAITILQLLQDVCDVLGKEFYVTLAPGGIITIGTIDISSPPSSFDTIIGAFDGKATELSYGQELRNEKTKALIFGEKQHYLTYTDNFEYFFGEDLIDNEYKPVVPFAHNAKTGFKIRKKIDQINSTLFNPLPNVPYIISELDIRCAMSSFDLWKKRAMDPSLAVNGTLNKAIQTNFPQCQDEEKAALDSATGKPNRNPAAKWKGRVDLASNPNRASAASTESKVEHDLKALHGFVENLGTTYYGKQWICKLQQTICVHQGENFQEKIFSDIPTGEGGWVDGDVSILGLSEPELTYFRTDDYRINSFALFNTDGGSNAPSDSEESIGIAEPEDPNFSPGQNGDI